MAGYRERALPLIERVVRRFGPAPLVLLAAFLVPAPPVGSANVLGVPSICPFHNLTGLPCPGCGITRSLVCCAHGHWEDAFAFHPLGPLAFAALLFTTLTRLPGLERFRLPAAWVAPLCWAGLALVLIVWVVRLLGCLPPPP